MALSSAAEISRIPGEASKWTKDTLDCLSAKYDRRVVTDFEFVKPELSAALLASMLCFIGCLLSRNR
jgi:hypothetical protein